MKSTLSESKRFHLTQAGVDDLNSELETLKQRRLDVANRLKNAKEQGDLAENSDWADAQDEYKYVENRIDEIEHILQNVEIIKTTNGSRVVQLGSKVEIRQNGKKLKFTIVGHLESNPEEGKISYHSPVGRALMDQKVGDNVPINTPGGNHIYTVTRIS